MVLDLFFCYLEHIIFAFLIMHQKMKTFFSFFKDLANIYGKNKTDQMAAALSLYAIFSLPSLIVLLVMIGSFFYAQSEIKTGIATFLSNSFGTATGQSIVELINSITASSQKTSVTILSFLMLVIVATALFEHILNSLKIIWNMGDKEKISIGKILWNKVYAFLFILLIDFVFFLSFFIKNILGMMKDFLPFLKQFELFFTVLNFMISLLLPFILFFFILKFLSHVRLGWKDAVFGSLVTSLLFMFGNFLLGIYFKHFVDYSAFGAANTVITMLLWIYYVSQTLFIGAEITYLWAEKYGPNKARLS